MAPSIGGIVSAPAEALDSFLSQHDSHSSLEMTRDAKIRDAFPTKSRPEMNAEEDENANTDDSLGDDLEKYLVYSTEHTEYASHEVSGDEGVMPGQYRQGKSFYSGQEGKILPMYNEGADHSGILTQYAEVDPEESLIPHHASISKILHKQQGDLLEQALKDTESIVREEEEWAVVEKKIAEDLSFTKTIGELLQSADFQRHDRHMAHQESLQINNRKVIPFGDGAHLVLPFSMLPSSSYEPQRMHFFNSRRSYKKQQEKRYENILLLEAAMKAEGSPNVFSHSSASRADGDDKRMAAIDKAASASLSVETVVSAASTSVTDSPAKSITTNLPVPVTTSRTITKVTKRNGVSSTTSTTQKPSKSEANVLSETESLSALGAVTRIPEVNPEVMANLDIVNSALPEQFLRNQGVRALGQESSMTAGGATAIILSGVCVLFIALISIVFFFKQQRKQRLLAKYVNDVEEQRQKHILGQDGKAMYLVPPPPYSVAEKSQPVSSKAAHSSSLAGDALAERMARKSKMAAECSSVEKNKTTTDGCLETSKTADNASKPLPPVYE